MQTQDNNSEKTNDQSCLSAVSSSDFRIVEYKDHFRVEKKQVIDVWAYFLEIPLWIKGQKTVWNCMLKNKTQLGIRNWFETENYQFKTKEECEQWISDYSKYPVYHYC
jgi:hypothetical protein